jgi:hypothetical protein
MSKARRSIIQERREEYETWVYKEQHEEGDKDCAA